MGIVGPKIRAIAAVAALTVAAASLTACGGDSKSDKPTVTLSLVAYSTPQAAYEALIKAYQKTDGGKNIKFTQSYGASGDQSRAVAAGLKADLVAFSLEPDITRLVTAKLVDASLEQRPVQGHDHRLGGGDRHPQGQPEEASTDWDDLTKPGVQVLTPNPFTSGGAKWNILAGYGAKSNKGADKATGAAYLQALFNNVPVQDSSGRASLQTFTSGKGDAIISYENEAIFAQKNEQDDRLHGAGRHHPDREPDRGHHQQRAPDRGQGVPGLAAHRRPRRRSTPRTGTGRSSRAPAARASRPRRSCSPSRTWVAGPR